MNAGELWVADGFSLADVRRAEKAAMSAWPPAKEYELDGWLVRRTPDTSSRRANSAVARTWRSGVEVETAILGVEGFYNEHGAVPRFQMSPTSEPLILDTILAERDYDIEAPVRVMTVDPASIDDAVKWQVRLDEVSAPAWRDAFAATAPSVAEADGRTAMVERARSRGLSVAYASIRDNADRVASIGVGVFSTPSAAGDADGWSLVFSMNTLPDHRRQGMGRAIVAALMGRAVAFGCDTAYLQVETNNPGAIAVYEGLGFRDLYAYHYRSLFGTGENG
ncbi:MAG: GNAT family N-acetyltransferase [Rhodospirillales bacterium]